MQIFHVKYAMLGGQELADTANPVHCTLVGYRLLHFLGF